MYQVNTEMKLLKKSHFIISQFLKEDKNYCEEILFIDFRPFWLSKQTNVYKNIQRFSCCICFEDFFKECEAKQHNIRHPSICNQCYKKLFTCPFCRFPLFCNILSVIS